MDGLRGTGRQTPQSELLPARSTLLLETMNRGSGSSGPYRSSLRVFIHSQEENRTSPSLLKIGGCAERNPDSGAVNVTKTSQRHVRAPERAHREGHLTSLMFLPKITASI